MYYYVLLCITMYYLDIITVHQTDVSTKNTDSKSHEKYTTNKVHELCRQKEQTMERN